jgi:Glycosyltransferase family 87
VKPAPWTRSWSCTRPRSHAPRVSIGAVGTFAGAAVTGVVMSVVVASGRPILASRWSLLGQLAVWGLAWIVAVAAAFRLPRRLAVVAVMAVGVALRIAALAGPPTTSDDLYRYSWDGRVQSAGIDPYAYAPASPALAGLRDPWLWPDPAGCAALHRPTGCTRVNRPPALTIYPPVAEGWFAAAYRLAGAGARHKTWQVAGLVTELGVLALLPVALRRYQRDPRWLALYALSPVPVVEVVNNGHVDGLAVVAIVAALAVAAGPRTWWRDVGAGALIALAALVKLYPAVLLVALVAMAGSHRYRSLVRAGITAAVVAALAYFPHVVRVGPRVLGYLPGYLSEEHYNTGARFLLANLTHLPGGPMSALALAGVVAWVLARKPPVPVIAGALLGALLLATSPVQPWYAVTLLAVATVAGAPWWAAVVVAGYPYFFAIILEDRHATGHGQVAYGLALLVVVAAGRGHGLAPEVARRRELQSDPSRPDRSA